MGRGPYEKSGMIRESGLPPHRTVTEKYAISFPQQEVKEGEKTVMKLLSNEMIIDIELWYLPFGVKDSDNSFLWQKVTKQVTVSKTGK